MPSPRDVIVPAEVVPLPQSISAVKLLSGAFVSAAEKVATTPVKAIPGLAVKVTALPVKAASVMVKVCAAVVPRPGVNTVTEAVPAWASRLSGTTAIN